MSIRHYGLQIGDKVKILRLGKPLIGTVFKFDFLDNNRCYIYYKEVLFAATCEECKKLLKEEEK